MTVNELIAYLQREIRLDPETANYDVTFDGRKLVVEVVEKDENDQLKVVKRIHPPHPPRQLRIKEG